MLTWDLITTFAQPLAQDWEDFALKILGDQVHPQRREGFLLSRMALQNVFERQGISLSPRELELDDFSRLKSLSPWKLSLSHCKGAGAAVLSTDLKIIPGIDIELGSREVSESVFKKVSHSQDITLRKIELWCLKEAAFKSLMNSGKFSANIHFADIIIGQGTWAHPPSGLEGKWTLHQPRPFILALSELEIETSAPQVRDC